MTTSKGHSQTTRKTQCTEHSAKNNKTESSRLRAACFIPAFRTTPSLDDQSVCHCSKTDEAKSLLRKGRKTTGTVYLKLKKTLVDKHFLFMLAVLRITNVLQQKHA